MTRTELPPADAATRAPAPPRAPRKRRWRRVLKLVAINVVVLVAVDFVVGAVLNERLFTPAPELIWGQRSDELGFRPRPSVSIRMPFKPAPSGELTLVHNAQGFRNDREFSATPAPGVRRIAVVGDSHTAGIADNAHTYAAALERSLAGDGSVEVINAGVKRYSPYQTYLRLEKDVLPFKPEVVIAAIYIGNDLMDLLRSDDRPYLRAAGDTITAHPPEFVVYRDPPLAFWSQRSFLYRLYRDAFGYQVDRVLMLADLVGTFGGGWSDAVDLAALLGQSGSREIISQTLGQTLFFTRYPAAEDRAFTLLQRVVEMHLDLARRDGHDLRFLMIPTKLQVEPRLARFRLRQAYEAVGLGPEHLKTDDALYARAVEVLREAGARVIDPLEPMREEALTGHGLYWYELHLNNWGAEVVGPLIADDLRGK